MRKRREPQPDLTRSRDANSRGSPPGLSPLKLAGPAMNLSNWVLRRSARHDCAFIMILAPSGLKAPPRPLLIQRTVAATRGSRSSQRLALMPGRGRSDITKQPRPRRWWNCHRPSCRSWRAEAVKLVPRGDQTKGGRAERDDEAIETESKQAGRCCRQRARKPSAASGGAGGPA